MKVSRPSRLRPCSWCGVESLIRNDSQTGFCSLSCSAYARNASGKIQRLSGAENPSWRGSDAGYSAKHLRVRRLRGKASSCPWGCESTRYEWANLTGNYDDPWDYASMCKKCHQRYDIEASMRYRKCGSNSSYAAGCGCEACKCAHAEYNLEWKRKRRSTE